MAMVIGDTACTTGLSKRIYDEWTGGSDNGFSAPLTVAQANAVKALCYAIAKSVVDEITTNARVDIVVHAAHDAALQVDPVTLADTLAPSLDRTLVGGLVY